MGMIEPWRKNFDVEHGLTYTNVKHLNVSKCLNVSKVLYVPSVDHSTNYICKCLTFIWDI